MDDNKQKKGIKPGVVVAIVVCVIAVCAGAVFGMYKFMSSKQVDNTPTVAQKDVSGSNLVITEDSRISASDISEKVSDGMIVVKMTGKWTFNSDCTSSNAYLANSERNKYPLKFEITLQDTGEVILTTPEVPVGSSLENFGLPKKLESGTYDVVIAHQSVKDGEVFSTVRTAATIIVE